MIPIRAIVVLLAVSFLQSCLVFRDQGTSDVFEITNDLDSLVPEFLALLDFPVGVGIAIYTNNGSYAHGFGLADVESGEEATAETAFYIASSTKSFNALAFNILHHRNEINLDATLSEYAPDAQFPKEILPEKVTLRDLLTHTSGIYNNPISFRSAFSGDHTPELLWDLLSVSTINSNAPIGTFQYTNTGYNILTILTDRQLGIPWQDIIKKEIIDPLGMTHTTAYMSQAQRENWPIARPHGQTDDFKMIRTYLEKVDSTMQSAGGMIMSPNDAVRWLELFVNDGMVGGVRLVDPQIVRETRNRFSKVDRQFGEYLREDYGLGWYVSSYNNSPMIQHFGEFSGFRAHVSYMPDLNAGVAVFVNDSMIGNFLADAIANYVYDGLTESTQPSIEGNEEFSSQLIASYEDIKANVIRDRSRRAARVWQLSHPIEAYSGRYLNSELGELIVSVKNNGLHVEIGVMRSVAEPFTSPDSLRLSLNPISGTVLEFDVNAEGEVVAANIYGAHFERDK